MSPKQNPHASPPIDALELQQGSFPRIVIVGAGLSGLCLAIQLKRAGIESFVILEKSDGVGGTWLHNTYPGCACDVPSFLYSYSFAPKYDWSRKFSPQQEILDYFRDCAKRYDILRHIQFGVAVETAAFDEADQVWRIHTESQQEWEADVFVSAVGQLSRPKIPQIEGLETYAGKAFHTARWDQNFEAHDRRIAVIGNGASAIQVVPQLAKSARQVMVFQRSPNWIAHRRDHGYPRWLQKMFRWVPGMGKLHRLGIYTTYESRILLYRRRGWLNNGFTGWLRYRMAAKLPPSLHAAVIPKYPAGCKRVLLSNDYLESLHRENVEVVTRPIRRIDADGVVTDQGSTPLDAIVFATGFEAQRFLYPMQITGRDRLDLNDVWQDRPKTYLGLMCVGFPNFFMLYGPNTNLGHNSIIFMVERQVNYLLRCLKSMTRQQHQLLEVREDAVEKFDRMLQHHLRQKVWNGYVSNWYKNEKGHIVNNWGRSTASYWALTRKPNFRDFHCEKRERSLHVERAPIQESPRS